MGQVDRKAENSNILFLAGASALVIILLTLAEQTANNLVYVPLSVAALIVGGPLFYACIPASEGNTFLRISAAILASLISIALVTFLGGISPEQGQRGAVAVGALPILCLIFRARA